MNRRKFASNVAVLLIAMVSAGAGLTVNAQKSPARKSAGASLSSSARPKLVVLLVVDQMRGDYVDKFQYQWTGGLKRLVREGAWFRAAAYPYAATETCVGHSTISTGALPASHGMVANAWWDRETQKMVTCTADLKVTNIGYAGANVKGGDSAWRMEVPAFAEELKFQLGGAPRVVTVSLKARAAITMAGHKGDAVTWFDAGGALTTSTAYGAAPFVEEFAKAHPVKADYGKSWTLSLPASAYLYDEEATGAVPPKGWGLTFPHPLRGNAGSTEPDEAFYDEWATSSFADTYLTKLAETAIGSLHLGNSSSTDFLGVSYSSVDYVGHAFGPRSREIQEILIGLDRNLAELFATLDRKVGRANYVVALSADHGVVPVPEQMEQTGADSGVLHLPELRDRLEKVLEAAGYPNPSVARVAGSDVYFAPGVYDRLKQDEPTLKAVRDAVTSQPGVAGVYGAEQVRDRPATASPLRSAFADSYFAGRSGDLFISPKPYWLLDSTPVGKKRGYGTGHGTPYNYDQHVPVLFMGYGVRPGEYFEHVTPADIAPTLAALCGVTLATHDGRALGETLAGAMNGHASGGVGERAASTTGAPAGAQPAKP